MAGRERILLDRFYNELSANPSAIDGQTRRRYALPGAIHDAFGGQFAAFVTNATDNEALFASRGKLTMPTCLSVAITPMAHQWPRSCPMWPPTCEARSSPFGALDHGRAAAAGERPHLPVH